MFACGTNGFIGFGNTAPSERAHVTGNLRVTGAFYDSNNTPGVSQQILSSTVTGTDWVDISSIAGVTGTGGTNFVTYWVDSDTITGTTGFTYDPGTSTLTVPSLVESSARRFKTEITPLTGSLSKIREMQGVSFKRISGGGRREIGFVAEQVQGIYPELVSYDPDGQIHGIQYPRVTAVLAEGMKELSEKIEVQEKLIQELKSRIARLENR
jgi:hypothetical protein